MSAIVREYDYPFNLYKAVHGVNSDITYEKMSKMIEGLKSLSPEQNMLLCFYFYKKYPYSQIAIYFDMSTSRVMTITKDSIRFLQLSAFGLPPNKEKIVDKKALKREHMIEKVIREKQLTLPLNFFDVPKEDTYDKIGTFSSYKSKSIFLDTQSTHVVDKGLDNKKTECLGSSKVVQDNKSAHTPSYIPAQKQYTYVQQIGSQVPDLWSSGRKTTNKNMQVSSTPAKEITTSKRESQPSLKSKQPLSAGNKGRTPKGKSELIANLNMAFINSSNITPGSITLDDCTRPISKDWPSNLISKVFNANYQMIVTKDQKDGLSYVLSAIKVNYSEEYKITMLHYMYGEDFRDLASEYGVQINTIRAKISKILRILRSAECKGFIYYGLEGYRERKRGKEETLGKDLLCGTTLSPGVVELLRHGMKFSTVDDLLSSSAKDIIMCKGMSSGALLEVYIVLYHKGFTSFKDGKPLVDLIDPKLQKAYRRMRTMKEGKDNDNAV